MPGLGKLGNREIAHNDYRVSVWEMKNFYRLMMVMAINNVNVLNATELYT